MGKLKKLNIFVFCVYLWLLIWVIALKYNNSAVLEDCVSYAQWSLKYRIECMLQLFKDVRITSISYQNIANLIIYLPFGGYLYLITKKIDKTILLTLVSTLLFEFIQLFTGLGWFDTYDILFNFVGGILGLVIAYFVNKFFNEKVNKSF